MKKMKFTKVIYLYAYILFFTSCVDKLDFSQVDDYTASPVYTSSLAYFTLTSSSFIDIKNELDRDFIININLLDDDNTVVYNFSPLTISANQLDFTHQETINVVTNPTIVNFTKVSVKVDITPSSTPLNSSDINEFEFKSFGTLYLKID